VPIGQLPLEERKRLAEQWGYESIGAELPDGVTLTDIVKTMPSEVCCVWFGGGGCGVGGSWGTGRLHGNTNSP
jgi:hypothetical protein